MKYKLHKIYMKPSSDQPLQNKRTFKLFNTVISYHMLMPSLACMFYLLYSYSIFIQCLCNFQLNNHAHLS